MKLRHWGYGLRGLYALVVGLPIGVLSAVAWFGFGIISDLVEVCKKSIVELPAEKGIEVANMLARVHDRSEVFMLGVPLVCAVVLVTVNASLLARFFSRVTSRGVQVQTAREQMEKVTHAFTQTAEKIELSTRQSTAAAEQSVIQLEFISGVASKMTSEVGEADRNLRVAVEETEKSETELQQLIESLSGLVKQSKKLEEITAVIESIAFQTNILAVNAAVEAARAGEHGRGFAIVAEAVRNLAQTSAASAKNIANMIRDSGETSKRAIDSIRSGTEGMSSTLNLIRRSRQAVGTMVAVHGEFKDSVIRLSQSLNQLESSSHLMVGTVDEVRQSREEAAKCIQDLSHASQGLTELLLSSENISDEIRKAGNDKSPAVETGASTHESSQSERHTPSHKSVGQTARPAVSSESTKRFAKRSQTPNTITSSRTQATRSPAKTKARDIIPFEGESESEVGGDSKIGSISGF